MVVRNFIKTEEILFDAIDARGNLSKYTLYITERSNERAITFQIKNYTLEYSVWCYKRPRQNSFAMLVYNAFFDLQKDSSFYLTLFDYCTVIDKIIADVENQEEK